MTKTKGLLDSSIRHLGLFSHASGVDSWSVEVRVALVNGEVYYFHGLSITRDVEMPEHVMLQPAQNRRGKAEAILVLEERIFSIQFSLNHHHTRGSRR